MRLKTDSLTPVTAPGVLDFCNQKQLHIGDRQLHFIACEPLLAREPCHASIEGAALSSTFLLFYDNPLDPRIVARQIAAQPEAAFATPIYLRQWDYVPDDPLFSQQWALRNTGQNGGCALADIKVVDAWNITKGDSDVILGILDTGINFTHPDLAGCWWINPGEIPDNGIDDDGNGFIDDDRGWDFANDDNDPNDDYGHGSHVSGITAATMDNKIGMTGIAPRCRLMAVKIGGAYGLYDDDAVRGIVYAVDNGARVLNCSWGSYDRSELVAASMEYAYQAGVLVIAAAGNNNTDAPHYPGALPTVLAVASTDSCDQRSYWEPPNASNYGPWVAVSAPGSLIISTVLNDGYAVKSGTSMATPHVVGVAGLLLSVYPFLDRANLASRLVSTADSLDAHNQNDLLQLGSGRVDAARSLVENRHPALRLKSYRFDESGGDDDHNPQPGEEGSFNLTILNTWQDSKAFDVIIDCDDPMVTIDRAKDFMAPMKQWESAAVAAGLFTIAANCPADHQAWFQLRFQERDGDYRMEQRLPLVLYDSHPSLDGWPVTTGDDLDSSPALAPVGASRFGVIAGSTDHNLYFVSPHGHAIPGWPQSAAGSLIATAAIGDIDHDSANEIVIGDTVGDLYAFRLDGALQPGWPAPTGGHGSPSSAALADVDLDGSPEVIDATWSGKVYVLRGNGTLLPGWPQTTREGCNSCPATGDVNRDGYDEIIVADKAGWLYVWDYTGKAVNPWPQRIGEGFIAAPAVADIDQDGDLEIITADTSGAVSVWHHDGRQAFGWPIRLPDQTPASPAIADLFGNGRKEIIVASQDGSISVLDTQARELPGWPMKLPGEITASPTAADLDGQPGLEICQPAGASLFVLKTDGTILPGWPLTFNSTISGTPVLCALEGNGAMDIVTTLLNRKIVALSTRGLTENSAGGWPQYHYDSARTGSIDKPTSQPAVRIAGVLPVDAPEPQWYVIAWVANAGQDTARVTARSQQGGAMLLSGNGGYYSAPLVPPANQTPLVQLEIQAVDEHGVAGTSWPWLGVDEGNSPPATSLTAPVSEPGLADGDPDGPAILLAGYDLSMLTQASGGSLTILAYPVSPIGAPIVSVELYYQGVPTGIELLDDGLHGDFAAGDEVYGANLLVPPGALPAGLYQLGMRVRDLEGRYGPTWPNQPAQEPARWLPTRR